VLRAGTAWVLVGISAASAACSLVLGPADDWPMDFAILGPAIPPAGVEVSTWLKGPPVVSAAGEAGAVVITGDFVVFCLAGFDARGTRDGKTLTLRVARHWGGGHCPSIVERFVYRATFRELERGIYTVTVFHESLQGRPGLARVYQGTAEVR